jgi:hypothetical protein
MEYSGEDVEMGDDPLAEVRARHEPYLLAIDGVVGVALGSRSIAEPGIVVYVRAAIHAAAVPRELDGYPVVVEVTGEIRAQAVTRRASAQSANMGTFGSRSSTAAPWSRRTQ